MHSRRIAGLAAARLIAIAALAAVAVATIASAETAGPATAVPTPALTARPGDRAAILMKKHLTALGGEAAVRRIYTIISSADLEIAGTGMKGTVTARRLLPCFSVMDAAIGFLTVRQGYDGRRSWMLDMNGQLQYAEDSASVASHATECILESFAYALQDDRLTFTAAESDTIEGTPCETIDLAVRGGAPCRLFLDTSSWLLRRLDLDTPTGQVSQIFDDYRAVGGVMFPYAVEQRIVTVNQRIITRFRSIEVNAPLDPADFLPPAGLRKDYRFTGGSGVEEVPFTYRNRHLYIPVYIGESERELMFMLDSGAGMTVIDSAFAAGMSLASGGSLEGAGAGGIARFQLVKVPGYRIAGIELSEQTAAALPIADLLRSSEDIEMGGILGYDFLSRFVTRIDYERRLITFYEPDSFTPPPAASPVEAPLRHNIFSLEAALDGASGTFLLDTGANSSLLLRRFSEESGLTAGRRQLGITIHGAGGEEKAAICRFDSFMVGGHAILRPVFIVSSSEHGIGAFEKIAGLIGNSILERFIVTLDYGNQRIWLEPLSRGGDPFFADRAGLELKRNEAGAIVVAHVMEGSPGETAGLEMGDVIETIDGTEVSNLGGIEGLTALFRKEEGTQYTLTVKRRGREYSFMLTLGEYF